MRRVHVPTELTFLHATFGGWVGRNGGGGWGRKCDTWWFFFLMDVLFPGPLPVHPPHGDAGGGQPGRLRGQGAEHPGLPHGHQRVERHRIQAGETSESPTNIAGVNLVVGCSKGCFFCHYSNTCPGVLALRISDILVILKPWTNPNVDLPPIANYH